MRGRMDQLDLRSASRTPNKICFCLLAINTIYNCHIMNRIYQRSRIGCRCRFGNYKLNDGCLFWQTPPPPPPPPNPPPTNGRSTSRRRQVRVAKQDTFQLCNARGKSVDNNTSFTFRKHDRRSSSSQTALDRFMLIKKCVIVGFGYFLQANSPTTRWKKFGGVACG